jgi:DNA primase large subunit
MRIDLLHGGRRPWLARLVLALFKLRAGAYLDRIVAITYRPDLLNRELNGTQSPSSAAKET